MLGRAQFRIKEMSNVVVFNKLKYFGKIIKNSNGPVISNRGRFSFIRNRDNDCLLPQIRESVLKQAKIKNKSKYRYKNFRTGLNDKTWYTISSN
jgi:uncharacterized membrane protein